MLEKGRAGDEGMTGCALGPFSFSTRAPLIMGQGDGYVGALTERISNSLERDDVVGVGQRKLIVVDWRRG